MSMATDDGRGVVPVILVGGTWSWRGTADGQWYHPASPLALALHRRGLAPVVDRRGQPFVWQSSASGWRAWRAWFGGGDTTSWTAAAHALLWFVESGAGRRLPGVETHVICHSHGAQVAIIAAAIGLRIHTLVDVGGPVREDVIRQYGAAARPRIGYWLSVHDAGRDWWRILGGVGDGHVGVRRQHPLVTAGGRGAHYAIAGAGHSRPLTHPDDYAPLWDQVADLVRSRHGREADQAR
ncbi:MAG: hypothetical protein Q8L86_10000 [Vicinamibacterales bacterium]|nr:hypothetical protein [Vicinamibacterales bacterium]